MRILKKYKSFLLNENNGNDNYTEKSYDPDDIMEKIYKIILWLPVNHPFYNEILSNLNIYKAKAS